MFFADVMEPYGVKAPLLARTKCSCGEWMFWTNVVTHMMNAFAHKKNGKTFLFSFVLAYLWSVEVLGP